MRLTDCLCRPKDDKGLAVRLQIFHLYGGMLFDLMMIMMTYIRAYNQEVIKVNSDEGGPGLEDDEDDEDNDI